MTRGQKFLLLSPLLLLGVAAFVALGGQIVKWLWNWLMPPLFGLHTVTFWQALGLLILCRILFGGLMTRGSSRYDYRRRMTERWAERWKKMTPEERERFRRSWRGHWFVPPASESTGG
jgi:hypothetical protein